MCNRVSITVHTSKWCNLSVANQRHNDGNLYHHTLRRFRITTSWVATEDLQGHKVWDSSINHGIHTPCHDKRNCTELPSLSDPRPDIAYPTLSLEGSAGQLRGGSYSRNLEGTISAHWGGWPSAMVRYTSAKRLRLGRYSVEDCVNDPVIGLCIIRERSADSQEGKG